MLKERGGKARVRVRLDRKMTRPFKEKFAAQGIELLRAELAQIKQCIGME